MKRSWKILTIAGILLLFAAANLTISMRVQPEREVDAYKKFLRDHGEKLQLTEILPASVSASENSVDCAEAAFSIIGSGSVEIPNAMKMVGPGKALIGARQPDARNDDFTNTWDEFAATVEANRTAIDSLRQVLNRPKLDFQLDYTKDYEMRLSHLSPMKHSAQILDAAAIYQLHLADTSGATTNILTLLAIILRDTRDDVLISHLVRIAMAYIALEPTWELLQATNVTDTQLAAVQNSWQQLKFLKDAETAFEYERSSSDRIIEKTRNSHTEYKKLLDFASGGGSYTPWPQTVENATAGLRDAIGETMWRSSWSYSTELKVLREDQIIVETLRAMQSNQSEFYKSNYDAMSSRLYKLGHIRTGQVFFYTLRIPDFRDYFPAGGLSSSIRKTLQIETVRRIVITAIALKRFQLKHGTLPHTLNALAPEFIQSIPIDPNDGKTLKYGLNADNQYLLYSVGEDGRDDGGDSTPPASYSGRAAWNWLRMNDWVWPQPATEQEVKSFYEIDKHPVATGSLDPTTGLPVPSRSPQ